MGRNRRTRGSRKNSSKLNTILLIILILLISVTFVFFLIKPSNNTNSNLLGNTSSENNNSTPSSSDDIVEEEPPKDTKITMSVIGDIMCHDSQYKDAYVKESGSYDFSYVFSDIKYYLQIADIAVGNLETTFAGSKVGYSNYPTFNTPEQLAYDLKRIGLDVLSTANNHSLDKGYNGLVSTLNYLDDADIAHTGTYASAEDQNKILIQNVKGISMAFLSFTYGTNGIPVPSGKDYCVNLIDKDLILKQIELAKEQNPDMICVFMHWGVEYVTKPNKNQKDLADFLFQNGVDVILGGHPHVLQPMEKREITLEDGTTKDGFIIYSLGNFISGQNKLPRQSSAILNLGITKNGKTGKIAIEEITYVPTYMYKGPLGSFHRFKLLDIESNIQKYENGLDSSINKTTYNTLKQALSDIKEILGEETVKNNNEEI
jgi:poly-gamma-glutamate synthesis protein (capsule biosynthesis protein)